MKYLNSPLKNFFTLKQLHSEPIFVELPGKATYFAPGLRKKLKESTREEISELAAFNFCFDKLGDDLEPEFLANLPPKTGLIDKKEAVRTNLLPCFEKPLNIGSRIGLLGGY